MNKNIKIIGNSKQNSGRLTLSYMLGPLVFLLLAWFIGWQIVHQPDWRTSLDQVLHAVSGPGQWRLWLVIVLMPVNWGLEARKWQLALRPVGGMPFGDAFRAVFTGTTMASFTPNRMGEYLGRILYVKEGRRIAAISLTMLCSISQLLITLVIGGAGLYFIRPLLYGQTHHNPMLEWSFTLLAAIVGVLLTGLALLYFALPRVAHQLSRFAWIRKIGAFIKVLENFDTNILLRILFLSFVRYIVFMIQYSLVFPVFGIFLSFSQVWGGMSVVSW